MSRFSRVLNSSKCWVNFQHLHLFSKRFSTLHTGRLQVLIHVTSQNGGFNFCAARTEHTWRSYRHRENDEFQTETPQSSRRFENNGEDFRSRSNYRMRPDRTFIKGELIYGIGPCLAALKAGRRRIFAAYIAQDREGSEIEDIRRLAEEAKIDIKDNMSKRGMTSHLLRKEGHQGVVLDVGKLQYLPLWQRDPSPDVESSDGKPPLWVLLNQVQDPMNLGAILRSCSFFGVQKVVTTRRCSQLSPVVSKASAGVMEVLPVYKALDTQVLLQSKQEEGWDVIGAITDSNSSSEAQGVEVIQCEDFSLEKPTILVFGNEGFGIDHDLRNLCTKMITIQAESKHLPIIGLDSLNVSVSIGVLLFSILRRNASNVNVNQETQKLCLRHENSSEQETEKCGPANETISNLRTEQLGGLPDKTTDQNLNTEQLGGLPDKATDQNLNTEQLGGLPDQNQSNFRGWYEPFSPKTE